jgi:tetratricopeptide (TPR) repeat protein
MLNWGFDALSANRPAETVRVLGELAGDYPLSRRWVGHWWGLAAGYHLLGRHQDELRAARRGEQIFPRSLVPVNAELRALAAEGRVDEVTRVLERARTMQPDPSLSSEFWGGAGPWQPYEAALEFRAHGHVGGYRRTIQQALETLRTAAPTDTSGVTWQWGRALALYAAERWEEAQAVYARLQAADPKNVELLGGLGVSEARLGHRAEASAMAARLADVDPGASLGKNSYWRARIAALLGDRDGAVSRLREALTRGMTCTYHFGVGTEDCHRDMDFESLRGYPPFDELLRPKR